MSLLRPGPGSFLPRYVRSPSALAIKSGSALGVGKLPSVFSALFLIAGAFHPAPAKATTCPRAEVSRRAKVVIFTMVAQGETDLGNGQNSVEPNGI